MKHVAGALGASLCAALAVLLLSWTNYFEQLNLAAYDFTLRLAGTLEPESPTVIVTIDEDSLNHVGPWPWSRDKLAQVIERIERDGPRVIAIDLLLDDKKDAGSDGELAAAVSHAGSIVLATR